MKIKSLVLFSAVLSLSLSCTSTKTIYKHLTNDVSTLTYLNESDIVSKKLPITIELDTVSILYDLKHLAQLTKKESKVAPFLIYNSWEYGFDYKIGVNSYKEELDSFFSNSIENEIFRSGRFNLNNNSSKSASNYKLKVYLEDLNASGPLQVDGNFLFLLIAYSVSENQSAGPGTAYSKIKYQLFKNDELVLESSQEHSQPTEMLQTVYQSSKKLRQDFNTSLIEAASHTIKVNIETMVSELNQYLESQKIQ